MMRCLVKRGAIDSQPRQLVDDPLRRAAHLIGAFGIGRHAPHAQELVELGEMLRVMFAEIGGSRGRCGAGVDLARHWPMIGGMRPMQPIAPPARLASDMRILLSVALVLGLSIVPLERAAACSCVQSTPAEAAGFADAAFAGTVVAQRDIGAEPGLIGLPPAFGATTIYTFAVDGVAKGPITDRVDVLAGGDGAGCGMSFDAEHRWLVFTTIADGVHTSGLCSGNVMLEPGMAAPLELAEPVDADENADARLPVPAAVILGALALVFVASWLAFRRGRAQLNAPATKPPNSTMAAAGTRLAALRNVGQPGPPANA